MKKGRENIMFSLPFSVFSRILSLQVLNNSIILKTPDSP